MSHYFIADNTLEDDYQEFDFYYGTHRFSFVSNSGMFSPGHVDFASSLLIKTLPSLSGSLLDMGCGYGPIGIVLAKEHQLDLTLADINARALECARKNCDRNTISADVICTNCFQAIVRNFDQIVINPPIHAGKSVIFEMYEQSYAHLNQGGRLFIVIQEKHGAKSTINKLTDIFGNCSILYKKKGYYILSCAKTPTENEH